MYCCFINECLCKMIFLIILFVTASICQDIEEASLKWCVSSNAEMEKCSALGQHLKYYQEELRDSYNNLECIQRSNHDECMILLDQGNGDVVNLDANQIFHAGRYHSLMPIMKEVYQDDSDFYFSVAILMRGRNSSEGINSLDDLRGSTACFPSVHSMAGWVIPIATLISNKIMEIVDCNSHVKSASHFFKSGCAVNLLTNKYNPLGDNPHTLCNSCGSEEPGVWCSTHDAHAGYVGALKCLVAEGTIAFVKHNTLMHAIESYPDDFPFSEDDFELLCLDGQKKPLSDYESCNWGEVPANTIAVSSAKTTKEMGKIQNFLKIISAAFSEKPEDPSFFHLFESFPKYGRGYDLLVSDDAKRLIEVASTQQNFIDFLTPEVLGHIEAIRSCPISRMVFCVVSYIEYDKCVRMKTAINAQLLKPELGCVNGNSQVGCMLAVRNKEADVAVFEAGDLYYAGKHHDLIPILAEKFNLDTTHYYVVAVAEEADLDSEVSILKDRNLCFPSMMHGGGWVVPMAYLLDNHYIRDYGCNSVLAASEYFQKSCVPGALSFPYNHGMHRYNLCHLCHGTMTSFCARDHTEPYYGFTGAFQCMMEGGGNLAFVKHTTIFEITDGKKKAWWARFLLWHDFQLLCRNGRRVDTVEWESCNYGLVRSPAVVTRGGALRNDTEIHAYVNLLLYAQQYFGKDVADDWTFKMFHSSEPYADLIFQDATQQLVPVEEEEQNYETYLGPEFLKARKRVDCQATSSSCLHQPLLMLLVIFFYLMKYL